MICSEVKDHASREPALSEVERDLAFSLSKNQMSRDGDSKKKPEKLIAPQK